MCHLIYRPVLHSRPSRLLERIIFRYNFKVPYLREFGRLRVGSLRHRQDGDSGIIATSFGQGHASRNSGLEVDTVIRSDGL